MADPHDLDSTARPPFRLGPWRIDPSAGTLRGKDGQAGGGERLERLEPKTFEVLLALTDSPGLLVARSTILERAWGDTIIEEGAVSRAVAEIRKALGDDARAPRYIETLPKRGYRLIARVEPIVESVVEASGEPSVQASSRRPRRMPPRSIWTFGAALLALAAIGWFVWRQAGAGPSETFQPAALPTPEAYAAYLRGMDLVTSNLVAALANFEASSERDATFALAWAEQSLVQSSLYESGIDRTEERCAKSARTVETAGALLARHPHVRIAAGYYSQRCRRDYASALAEFEKAAELEPGNPSAIRGLAYVYRLQGEFEQALLLFEEAARLEPERAIRHYDLAQTLTTLERYDEAERALDRALEIEPGFARAMGDRAFLSFLARGDLSEARRRAERIPASRFLAGHLAYLARDAEAALRIFASLDREIARNQTFVQSRALWLGFTLRLADREEEARAAFSEARARLEAEATEHPEDRRIPGELGLAYASLGDRERALAAGRRAIELLPAARDAVEGPAYLVDMARIHALLGEVEPALDLLEELLAMAAGQWISVARIEADPRFDTLRHHPRYRKLVASR